MSIKKHLSLVRQFLERESIEILEEDFHGHIIGFDKAEDLLCLIEITETGLPVLDQSKRNYYAYEFLTDYRTPGLPLKMRLDLMCVKPVFHKAYVRFYKRAYGVL